MRKGGPSDPAAHVGAAAAVSGQARTKASPGALEHAARPELKSCYGQKLKWSACGGFRCADLTVPMDYAHPKNGKTFVLPVAKAVTAWELWGKTSVKVSARKLASGITDSSRGNFKACYDASGTLPEAHMKFRSSSSRMWRAVRDRTSDTEYTFNSASRFDVSTSQNFGAVKVPARIQNAWHVVDTLNLLYWKRSNPRSDCWTSHQVTGKCDRLIFVWEPSNNPDSGFWDLREGSNPEGTNNVILSGSMADSEHLILHEAGPHAFPPLSTTGAAEGIIRQHTIN